MAALSLKAAKAKSADPKMSKYACADFDLLAPHYDWMEALSGGGLLQRVRTALLPRLDGCESVLTVGEGHGRFAAACAKRFPTARLTCLEASSRMLDVARRRLARDGIPADRVSWVQAVVPEWIPPSGAFDAIATCFFLDCFDPQALEAVVGRLARGARARAKWVVVDFSIPDSGLARRRALVIHRLMYGFFRVTTGVPARFWTPPNAALRANGFALAERREFDWGLLRAELWERQDAAPNSNSHESGIA